MRRMELAANPLSHIALPGIGMALAFHIHPISWLCAWSVSKKKWWEL
jgi:ABC-type Mn2+/Zn2+ transport system permease subunit